MPKISIKGLSMPASPIRKLVPYAEKAKKEGRTVYHLNIGQPDIRTPQVVMDRLKNLKRTIIEYSNSEGYSSYRNSLAKYYQANDINVSSEDITITTGGSEALIFGFLTCMNPGDEVIIPEPFYANYLGFATMCGVKVRPVTASIDDGFALPSLQAFEKLITEKTKAILICNPGNPTGYLYKKAELEALRDIIKKHDLFLFADEVYREFCYDGAIPFSVMNLEGIDQNVILIDSVSKRYSMCGARIGALISKNKEVNANVLKFAQARLSPPTLGQIAGEAALETPPEYFEEVKAEYTERRDLMVDGLNQIPGVFCPKPSGAFYCIARLPVDNSERFCQWMLEEFNHENQTVMMAPATGFYATEFIGDQQVRIAYVLNKASLQKALECLEIALLIYPGKVEIPGKLAAKKA